jgi:restriction endonuclease S subunit
VIRAGQFAFGPVTSRNGDKISIALMDTDEAIVSTSYTVFEIIDHDLLLPEYLNLWFKRAEFDRYTRFMSHGSVREIFDWNMMCQVELPVPSIQLQRTIISRSRIISTRISQLSKLISTLRSFGINQLMKEFANKEVDPLTISYEDLRVRNYQSSTLSELTTKITAGGTPSRDNDDFWSNGTIPWLKISEINDSFIFNSEEYITIEALKKSSAKLIKPYSLLLSMYCVSEEPNIGVNKIQTTTNQAICAMEFENYSILAYSFFYLKAFGRRMLRSANGSVQTNLNKNIIENFMIIMVYNDSSEYEKYTKILNQIENYQEQLILLKRMSDSLISNMG